MEAIGDGLPEGVEGERRVGIVGVDDQNLQRVHVQVGGLSVISMASMPLSRFTSIPLSAELEPYRRGAVRRYSAIYGHKVSRRPCHG
jgi:hypothetical protein